MRLWLVLALSGLASLAWASEASYEKHVPRDMREQVTSDQFQSIMTDLDRHAGDSLNTDLKTRIAASPCGPSLNYLVVEYYTKPKVRAALSAALAGFKDPPASYGFVNPWKGAATSQELLARMLDVFTKWCVFLPEINGDQDNGLVYIQYFAWFYYQNEAGVDFVQGRDPLWPDRKLKVGKKFTQDFSDQRGAFMFSRASRKKVRQWAEDPRIEISDYQKQKPEEYGSWNDFFAREIIVDTTTQTIPSRPTTMPDRDYVVSSPTDCIMNPLVQVLVDELDAEEKAAIGSRRILENPLQYDTVLDVKGIPISLKQLLKGVPEDLRQQFVGGTGLSCVLMPNTYHHYHAPVSGEIMHAEVITHDGTYGYIDWPNWVPQDGNVGRLGTDFSEFDAFERGVIIIKVTYDNLPGVNPAKLTGYVASIPVGLDTIGSVVLDDSTVKGAMVKRGYTRLGGFYYGGSLNILLFSKGLATGAVQTRLGNQIGILNVGEAPAVK